MSAIDTAKLQQIKKSIKIDNSCYFCAEKALISIYYLSCTVFQFD